MSTPILLQLADIFSHDTWLILSIVSCGVAVLCIVAQFGFRGIGIAFGMIVIMTAFLGFLGLIVNVLIVVGFAVRTLLKMLDRVIARLDVENAFKNDPITDRPKDEIK